MDALGISCSDGSTLGLQGGPGGSVKPDFYSQNAEGFRRYDLRAGDVIDGIKIYDDSTFPATEMYYGGKGGSNIASIKCPSH